MLLTCPASRCRAENEPDAEVCVRCQTPLRSYARLSAYPAALFNRGLAAARAGRLGEARDLFSAVMWWCPLDLDARNAFALACFRQGDRAEARRNWGQVLARSPRNEVALQGLAMLDRGAPPRRQQAPARKRSQPPRRKGR
jgi:Flp pilus assembly protein TadD